MMEQRMKVVACVIQSLNKMTGCQYFIKRMKDCRKHEMMEWSRLMGIIWFYWLRWLYPSEMIQSLYEQLIQEDADVSSCGVMNVYANDE